MRVILIRRPCNRQRVGVVAVHRDFQLVADTEGAVLVLTADTGTV